MGMPRDKDAKRFYRAAGQRWEDAEYLFGEEVRRTTAAVYLAGYCVECLLKALILSYVPRDDKPEVVKLFRGSKAHDYDWLRDMYYKSGGPRFPPDIVQAFTTVAVWGTEMRYQPGTIPDDEAADFMAAVQTIRTWADERL